MKRGMLRRLFGALLLNATCCSAATDQVETSVVEVTGSLLDRGLARPERNSTLALPLALRVSSSPRSASAYGEFEDQPCGPGWFLPPQEGQKKKLAIKPEDDYNKETRTPIVIWSEKSSIPVSVEMIIAVVWIAMVTGIPFISVWLFGGQVSRSQWGLHFAYSVIFFCGVYAFTNVILFNSVHFETQRSLTLVECVYLMSQILTTVGYGDITPFTTRGQVAIAIYVLASVVILANSVSEVLGAAYGKAEKKVEEVEEMISSRSLLRSSRLSVDEHRRGHDLDELREDRVARLPWAKFYIMFGFYLLLVIIGVCFFRFYPGEGRTIMQGLYMSIITLSTVGFGALTPLTEGGKVFGAFWMLFGSTALVGLIGAFTELTVKIREQEDLAEESRKGEHLEILNAFQNKLDKGAFLKFGLLYTHGVAREELEKIEEAFRDFQPGPDGKIAKSDIYKCMDYMSNLPSTEGVVSNAV